MLSKSITGLGSKFGCQYQEYDPWFCEEKSEIESLALSPVLTYRLRISSIAP